MKESREVSFHDNSSADDEVRLGSREARETRETRETKNEYDPNETEQSDVLSSDIADIDARLNALQSFLRAAKSGKSTTPLR